jgi:hypothetical protein
MFGKITNKILMTEIIRDSLTSEIAWLCAVAFSNKWRLMRASMKESMVSL